MIAIDNEKALQCASIIFILEDNLKIKVYRTLPYRSDMNGRIEWFHATLYLKAEGQKRTCEELLKWAVNEYNFTIHFATQKKKKPMELLHGRTPNINPEEFEKLRLQNIERLKEKQSQGLKYHNKTKTKMKHYLLGEEDLRET